MTLQQLAAYAGTHPVLSALLATTLFATASSLVGQLPKLLYGKLWALFSVRLEITGRDQAFTQLVRWMDGNVGLGKSRTLCVGDGDAGFTAIAGFGTHRVRHQGRLLLVKREYDKDLGDGWGSYTKERITITAFGRGAEPRNFLVDFVKKVAERQQG